MRRLLQALVCIFLLAGIYPVMAAENQKNEIAIKTMMELGIIEEKDAAAEEVTRAEFADYLCAMLRFGENEALYAGKKTYADVEMWHKSAGSVEYLTSIGIIDGMQDSLFYPDDAITYGQAYKLLVRSAGYDNNYVSVFGPYPQGDAGVAGQLNISKGISADADSLVSGQDMVRLLYNLLDAPCMQFSGAAESGVNFTKGTPFCQAVMRLYKVGGTLVSDGHISLTGGTPVKNTVVIGDKAYTCGGKNYSDLIGMEVTGYSYDPENGGAGEIAALCAAKSAECIVLRDDDIDKYENGVYSYYDGDSDKIKRISVGNNVPVVFNYALSGRSDIMVPKDGVVRLILNNGAVTAVIITAYETYSVDTVDRENMTIRTSDENTFSFQKTDFDFFTPDMQETGFDAIQQGSVISLVQNTDECDAYRLCIVSNKQIETDIIGLYRDSGGRPVIRGTGGDYPVQTTSPLYDQAEITGKYMKLFLDHEGKVFYAELSRDMDSPYYRYGYLIRVLAEEETEDIEYKILDQDGQIYRYKSKEKITVNDTRMDKEAAFRYFLWDEEQKITARQAVRYHTSNGIIQRIQTGEPYQEGTKASDRLLIRANAKRFYYKPNKTFKRLLPVSDEDRMTAEIIVADNPVVFMVPPETAMTRKFEDSEFKVIQLEKVMSEDKACWVKAFNTDSDRLDEDLIVYYYEKGLVFGKEHPYVMVTDVDTVYDEENQAVVTRVAGMGNNTSYIYQTENSELFNPGGYAVKRGDLIRVINSDVDGMAGAMELVFTPDYEGSIMGKNQAYYPAGSMRNTGYRLIYGRIERSNDGIISVIYSTDSEKNREFFRAGSLPIYVYDSDKEKKGSVYRGGAEDLKEGCRVLVVSFWAKPAYLFVYARE